MSTKISSVYKNLSVSLVNLIILSPSVTAKIVRHMKHRHMEGEDHPLSLDEILDETNQLDISGATKQWLLQEALGR